MEINFRFHLGLKSAVFLTVDDGLAANHRGAS